MPNTNAPFGFRPLRHVDGSPPTMGQERFFIYSSDANSYGTGDVVSVSSAVPGYLTQYGGSSLTPVPLGIFNGCEYYSPTVGRVVWNNNYTAGAGAASSTPVTAYVITDPNMLFAAQVSSANLPSSTNVGTNVTVIPSAAAGGLNNGFSQVTIASSIPTATGLTSLPFKYIDAWANSAPPGAPGTDNSSAQFFQIIIVKPNNWTFQAGTIGLSS